MGLGKELHLPDRMGTAMRWLATGLLLVVLTPCARSQDIDVIVAAGQSNLVAFPGNGVAAASPVPPAGAYMYSGGSIMALGQDGSALPSFAQTYVQMTGRKLL